MKVYDDGRCPVPSVGRQEYSRNSLLTSAVSAATVRHVSHLDM